MSGKHAGGVSARRSAAAVTLVGARELVVFAVIGVLAPLALLLAVPSLTEDGRAMESAPVCEMGGHNCLEPRPATMTSSGSGSTWTLNVPGGTVHLTFPRTADPDPDGDLRVVFWNETAVALLEDDGAVVGSTRWGRLYGVSERTLLLAPLWPAVLAALAVPLVYRRRLHRAVLVLLTLGSTAAGPSAYLGMLWTGYPGLVAGGLVPVALSLLLAGPVLWLVRRQARKPAARRAQPMPARMPRQRHQPQDSEPADVR